MGKQVEQLKELRTIIAGQQELLRIALYLMTEGPIKYADRELKCELAEDQVRATTTVAMGSGQSLNTIMKLSEGEGIVVRDLYGRECPRTVHAHPDGQVPSTWTAVRALPMHSARHPLAAPGR